MPSFTEEMACRDEFSREILVQAERLGVELAFPTQTIHLANANPGGEDGPAPPAPKYIGRERSEASALGAGGGNGPGRNYPGSGYSPSKV